MCAFGGGGSSGPSEEELARQRAEDEARASAQNTLAASPQGVAQNVSSAAKKANMRRIRHFGVDSTVTGAGAPGSGFGVGVKESLGQ